MLDKLLKMWYNKYNERGNDKWKRFILRKRLMQFLFWEG